MKFFSKYVLTGLVTILPILLTVYFLSWMIMSAETLMGTWIRLVLPAEDYWPGMGVALTLIVLWLLGLLMHAYVVRRIFAFGESLLYRVPVIKSVYGAISDFFTYFSPQTQRDLNQVVAVTVGDNLQLMGFVTREDTTTLPEELRGEDNILVYIPMSYTIGGYTLAMPRSAVRPMEMSMEQAMRFTLTAGVAGEGAGAAEAENSRD